MPFLGKIPQFGGLFLWSYPKKTLTITPFMTNIEPSICKVQYFN
jgi:hypothetical protein